MCSDTRTQREFIVVGERWVVCTLAADFNTDNVVNIQDIMQIVRRWGLRPGDNLYHDQYDLEDNDTIDVGDIMETVNEWRRSC